LGSGHAATDQGNAPGECQTCQSKADDQICYGPKAAALLCAVVMSVCVCHKGDLGETSEAQGKVSATYDAGLSYALAAAKLGTPFTMKLLSSLIALTLSSAPAWAQNTIVHEGGEGPGKGKHVVLLAGDEEYRSEEALPMLAKLLSQHHGFKTTVLFSLDANGVIDPKAGGNIEGIEALDSADSCIMLLRFRHWPEEKMKHFVNYMNAGKPIIALRTSTHAFNFPKDSPYADYTWTAKGKWPGGWGKQVLGETWVSHWGKHKVEATLGVLEAGQGAHPILRGVKDLFGDTDVYEAAPPADATILARGQVLSGMKPGDAPASYKKKTKDGVEQDVNQPMMPVIWTRDYKQENGATNKILCSTMGSATDLANEGMRRVVVNGVYWSVGLDIPADLNISVVDYKPTFYGFDGNKPGLRPADLK
jgi:hypothetical protein